MIYLVFKDTPIFREGLNISIRRGEEWMKASLAAELNVTVTGEPKTVLQTVELVGKAAMVFDLIPDELFQYAGCDMTAGAEEARTVTKTDVQTFLETVYNDFNPMETVTVLFFIPNTGE